jgi:serine/threonine-protein kinase SRPK3
LVGPVIPVSGSLAQSGEGTVLVLIIHIDDDVNYRNAYPSKYVAVKVLTVNATAGVLKGFLGEVDILKTVMKARPDHPGFRHCLHLYDAFIANSFHGPHICLVTNLLGKSLVSLRRVQPNGKGAFPIVLSKRIIKQTLLALDYLHRECDLVHTGE